MTFESNIRYEATLQTGSYDKETEVVDEVNM